MSAPGMPEAMALSSGVLGVGLYLIIWGTMMIAMMYPSSAHAFRTYYEALGSVTRTEQAVGVVLVMSTYTLVWMVTGLVSLGFNLVVPIAAITPENRVFLLAMTLLVLAAYQLSPYKRHHLECCRAPLAILDGDVSGVRGAVRSGWRLSIDSIGCCWALMVLVVVVGLMNLLWMVVITALISIETLAPDGERLASGIGVLAAIGGIGLLVAVVV